MRTDSIPNLQSKAACKFSVLNSKSSKTHRLCRFGELGVSDSRLNGPALQYGRFRSKKGSLSRKIYVESKTCTFLDAGLWIAGCFWIAGCLTLDYWTLDSRSLDSGMLDSGLLDASGLLDVGFWIAGPWILDSGLLDSGLLDPGLLDGSGLLDTGLQIAECQTLDCWTLNC